MLELLVTITLDALEESREGQLLLVAQLSLLFLNHCLHLSKSQSYLNSGQTDSNDEIRMDERRDSNFNQLSFFD